MWSRSAPSSSDHPLQCRERGALSGMSAGPPDKVNAQALQCRERGALSGIHCWSCSFCSRYPLQCRERGALSGMLRVTPALAVRRPASM